MKREPDPRQGDLFEWAAKRPTAVILDMIPGIARIMWRDIHNPPVIRNGTVTKLPLRAEERRRA